MRSLTPEARQQINSDPFYQQCCITGKTPVQIHHHFLVMGQQIDDTFQLLPLHPSIHDKVWDRRIRNKLDRIVMQRATEADMAKYPVLFRLIISRIENENGYLYQKD